MENQLAVISVTNNPDGSRTFEWKGDSSAKVAISILIADRLPELYPDLPWKLERVEEDLPMGRVYFRRVRENG